MDIRKELEKQAEIQGAKLLTENDYLFIKVIGKIIEENQRLKEERKLAKKNKRKSK